MGEQLDFWTNKINEDLFHKVLTNVEKYFEQQPRSLGTVMTCPIIKCNTKKKVGVEI